MNEIRGTVKWYDVKKGFGFITGDDGNDYFAHWREIRMDGFAKLRDGQRVVFSVGEDEQGRTIAKDITPEA